MDLREDPLGPPKHPRKGAGGRRPGAGRKTGTGAKRVNIMLSKEIYDNVRPLFPDKNFSNFVNLACWDRYRKGETTPVTEIEHCARILGVEPSELKKALINVKKMKDKPQIIDRALVEGFNAKVKPGDRILIVLQDGQKYQTYCEGPAKFNDNGDAVAMLNGHPAGYPLAKVQDIQILPK